MTGARQERPPSNATWARPDGEGLLAFVHIEKAAGTTLLYVLRKNFLFRYADVRPLRRQSNALFTASDLRTYLRLNPWLRCIAGHSIAPFVDLEAAGRAVRYVTLLRDPIARYLSQYRYWSRVLHKDWSFDRFLDHEPSHNLQTRKLCGGADLAAAQDALRRHFLLVGIVEEFDTFLLELKAHLAPFPFDPSYSARNIDATQGDDDDSIEEKYTTRIRENNALDLSLYAYVRDEVLPRQRSQFAGDLAHAVARSDKDRHLPKSDPRLLMDGLARKLYYEPVTGLIRRMHGLSMRGSY